MNTTAEITHVPAPVTSADGPPAFTVEYARCFMNRALPAALQRQDHGYSPAVARKYGIPAALVLRYLSFRASKSKRVEDGIQWHSQSIAEIASHYPYLSASTVHAALKRVPQDFLGRRRRKDRRTRAISTEYAFPDAEFRQEVNGRPIYFKPEHAQRFGIHAAVVLHSLQHAIRVRRYQRMEYHFHPVSLTDMAEALGISRASVARALATLVEGGMLQKHSQSAGRFPEYALTPASEPHASPANSGNDALRTA